MQIERHFTVTVAVVYKDKVLLHLHKKMNLWLFVGGHMSENELPEETAIREVKEETGLDVALFNEGSTKKTDTAKYLIQPRHLLLAYVNDQHQHMDLIYYAQSDSDQVDPAVGESNNLQWLTVGDLQKKIINVPPIIQEIAMNAIKIYNP